MIKYIIAGLMALMLSGGTAASQQQMYPGAQVYTTMFCKQVEFIETLATLHVAQGVDAARQRVAQNRVQFNSQCMNFSMPVEVILIQLHKEYIGPRGHVRIWKSADPSGTVQGYTVEFVAQTGA